MTTITLDKKSLDTTTTDIETISTTSVKPNFFKRAINYYMSSTVLKAMTGVILAFIIGVTVYETVTKQNPLAIPAWVYQLLALPGNFWLVCLRCLVLPLICSAMLISASSLRKMSKSSGKITLFTIGYYLTTTVIAATIGLMCSYLLIVPFVQPVDVTKLPPGLANQITETPELKPLSIPDQIETLIMMLVPSNIFKALTSGDLLGVVVVFMTLGFLIDDEGSYGSVILKGAHEIQKVVTIVMTFLINLLPFGVFFLILPTVMGMDIGLIISYVGFYIASLAVGVAILLFVVYPTLYLLLTRKNPIKVMSSIIPAVATAFGTSSSAASLPVTMACQKSMGVRDSIAGFVCPLGAVINMDAVSIYVISASMFMAASQGIYLSAGNAIVLVLVATLSSIGAAPIPSAGLVFILTTMNAVGIPNSPLFGLIIMIDWLADRISTMSNVAGDNFASAVVDARYGGELDQTHEELVLADDIVHQSMGKMV